MRMRAIAAVPGSKEPEFVEIASPRAPREGEVLCRTVELGICGTDREILHSARPLAPPGQPFLVLGHECLGRVEAVGPGVEDCAPGDLVVPAVRRPLAADVGSAGVARRVDLLPFGQYTERGIVGEHGFSAALWLDRPEHLYPVRPQLARWAVLTEPFSVAEKAINEAVLLQRARLGADCWVQASPDENIWQPETAGHASGKGAGEPPGQAAVPRGIVLRGLEALGERSRASRRPRVLVTGMGPIGFAAVACSICRGWPTVLYGRDREESSRTQLALSLGADYLPSQSARFEAIDPDRFGFDLVLECTGSEEAMLHAARGLASCGVMVWLGSSRVPEPRELNVAQLMRDGVVRNHLHLGSVNAAPRDFRDALAHLEQLRRDRPGALEGFITARLRPEEALDHFDEKQPESIKTVLTYEP